MTKYQIIAATGCPTGIAHTYMAQEALEQAAKRKGVTIKVETHGQIGIEHELTPEEIKEALNDFFTRHEGREISEIEDYKYAFTDRYFT